jgi:hypothetical protein
VSTNEVSLILLRARLLSLGCGKEAMPLLQKGIRNPEDKRLRLTYARLKAGRAGSLIDAKANPSKLVYSETPTTTTRFLPWPWCLEAEAWEEAIPFI